MIIKMKYAFLVLAGAGAGDVVSAGAVREVLSVWRGGMCCWLGVRCGWCVGGCGVGWLRRWCEGAGWVLVGVEVVVLEVAVWAV